MSSAQAQKQKILTLNLKDKKLSRLLSYSDLSDKDVMFINFIYEQKNQYHFRYGIVLTLFSGMLSRQYFLKSNPSFNATFFGISISLMNYLFWNSVINKRFERLINPYFQKYEIK